MLFAVTFCFELLICEREFALDLHHRAAFTNPSKPLRPHVCFDSELSIDQINRLGQAYPEGL